MRIVALSVAVLALSGCLSTGAPVQPAAVPAVADAVAYSGPAVQAGGCVEGGAHSVYNMRYLLWDFSILPEPWKAADVTEDLGGPLLDTQGVPVTGPVLGIYHPYIRCERYAFQGEEQSGPLEMGFVAIRVEPPPFDDGTIQRQYLLDVLSTSDEGLRALLGGAGFHATKGKGAFEEGTLLHTVFDDEEHGVYDTYASMRSVGAKEDGPLRLWMTLPGEDELYHPVAVDFLDTGGQHLAAQGEAFFTHTRTNDHPPLGGFVGWTSALAYTGFDREVRLGPAPDAALKEGWRH